MKIIRKFANNELLTFTDNNDQNLIKIFIDNNYDKYNIKKGYKINLIDSSKGSYKGSFMNNYICKKFKSNQKVNLTNIETNQILNYCKYFILSKDEYNDINLYINLNSYNNYKYSWLLRYPRYSYTYYRVHISGIIDYYYTAFYSCGFVPFFIKRREKYDNY